MSSPSSRLGKLRRRPLPEFWRVPFRQPVAGFLSPPVSRGSVDSTDPRLVVAEAIASSQPSSPPASQAAAARGGSTSQRVAARGGQRVAARGVAAGGGRAFSKAPSDSELLGSLAARLALVERELLAAKAEVIEKNARIRELEQKLSSLVLPPPLPPSTTELERRCSALQKQVEEMEEFLNDYGMVWVGSDGSQNKRVKGHSTEEEVWHLDSLTVDFDLLVKNIQSLSVVAGEGSSAVSTTPTGAQLKGVDAIPLTLYANGIAMFQGPFRPFSDPLTKQCVQDLMDGYFPSELEALYPEGVPFQLNDQRHVTFVPRPRDSSQIFPGSGQRLGGQRGPSKLYATPRRLSFPSPTTSDLPGPKLSTEQFLSRLPPAVVRGGRVLEVRSQISAILQGSPASPGGPQGSPPSPGGPQGSPPSPGGPVTRSGPTTDGAEARLPSLSPSMPPSLSPSMPPSMPPSLSPSHTSLKIRSETGAYTFVLQMRSHDTIADVWSHLLNQTGFTSLSSTDNTSSRVVRSQTEGANTATKLATSLTGSGYQLVSGVTCHVYSDLTASLLDCGLTPNATLYISRGAGHTSSGSHVTVM